jgi:hypothetical protein
MNNMGREIMAALKRFQVGSDGDGVTVGGNLVVSGSSTLATTAISSADINGGTIDGATIGGASAAAGAFTTLNTSGAVVFNDAGADVDFRVEGDTEANLLFVDASADAVGIGTSSPTVPLTISSSNSGGESIGLMVLNPNAGVQNTEASIIMSASGSTRGAKISGVAPITGSNSHDMVFSTSSGANVPAERMRITSAGNVGIGTSSPGAKLAVSGGGILVVQPTSIATGSNTIADTGASPNTIRFYNDTDSNNSTNRFIICDAGASVLRAEIRSNGGIANYTANDANLSDRREKTNFAPAKAYLQTICAIPVQTFNYIDQNHEEDPGLTLGVVAQDVQEVAPELVMESNWGSKDDPKMRLSIYQTDLQYALMKSIQELKAELDTVKAELATLKGN